MVSTLGDKSYDFPESYKLNIELKDIIEEGADATPINCDVEGNSKTIKAQYYKNSIANFTRKDGMSATGVLQNGVIRKFTPRECFRLMDVDDSDIDKIISAGISNTQMYKLAGNSIVVNVLYHIFRKLFISSPYGFHVIDEV